MRDTTYVVNGICWTCGSTEWQRSVRTSWCRGCNAVAGTMLWVADDREDAVEANRRRLARLAALSPAQPAPLPPLGDRDV